MRRIYLTNADRSSWTTVSERLELVVSSKPAEKTGTDSYGNPSDTFAQQEAVLTVSGVEVFLAGEVVEGYTPEELKFGMEKLQRQILTKFARALDHAERLVGAAESSVVIEWAREKEDFEVMSVSSLG